MTHTFYLLVCPNSHRQGYPPPLLRFTLLLLWFSVLLHPGHLLSHKETGLSLTCPSWRLLLLQTWTGRQQSHSERKPPICGLEMLLTYVESFHWQGHSWEVTEVIPVTAWTCACGFHPDAQEPLHPTLWPVCSLLITLLLSSGYITPLETELLKSGSAFVYYVCCTNSARPFWLDTTEFNFSQVRFWWKVWSHFHQPGTKVLAGMPWGSRDSVSLASPIFWQLPHSWACTPLPISTLPPLLCACVEAPCLSLIRVLIILDDFLFSRPFT